MEKDSIFKSTTIGQIIKSTFVETCSNTTAHALPGIFRSKYLAVKIIWLILFIIGLIASVYC